MKESGSSAPAPESIFDSRAEIPFVKVALRAVGGRGAVQSRM